MCMQNMVSTSKIVQMYVCMYVCIYIHNVVVWWCFPDRRWWYIIFFTIYIYIYVCMYIYIYCKYILEDLYNFKVFNSKLVAGPLCSLVVFDSCGFGWRTCWISKFLHVPRWKKKVLNGCLGGFAIVFLCVFTWMWQFL